MLATYDLMKCDCFGTDCISTGTWSPGDWPEAPNGWQVSCNTWLHSRALSTEAGRLGGVVCLPWEAALACWSGGALEHSDAVLGASITCSFLARGSGDQETLWMWLQPLQPQEPDPSSAALRGIGTPGFSSDKYWNDRIDDLEPLRYASPHQASGCIICISLHTWLICQGSSFRQNCHLLIFF